MPQLFQEFMAAAIEKAAKDLEAALLRIPEDKRSWSPAATSRSALDQAAECAILNGRTSEAIRSQSFPAIDYNAYLAEKAELARNWSAIKALLDQNTARAAEAVRATSDEALETEIHTQFGPMTIARIISYPYWNMSYHEGQINYIASILGCL